MEISTKKLVAVVIGISFVTSAIGGFAFGLAGSISGSKILPSLANGIEKGLEKIDKNLPADFSIPSLMTSSPALTGKDESLVVNAIKKADPSVVSIIITKDLPKVQYSSPFGSDFFSQFFGQNFNSPQADQGTSKQEVGRGSGFIVTSDGYILTNKHVANDKNADYTVLTNEGKEYPAKLIATDPGNDLAVIKIDQKDLPAVTLGDSNNLQVGQTAIAIGNALGEFRNTASLGIISGLGRSITASGTGFGSEQLSNIIQTDTAINPGNSGGPLLNLSGEVIGVNVAVAQGAQNIAFAIPVNDAKKAINDVRTKGRIVTAWLGVRYYPIDETLKEKNNLSVDYGVLVVRGSDATELAVIPGSPANKAGIEENDIILEINGTKIDLKNRLQDLIKKYSVGDEVILKVLHRGSEKEVKVKLEESKQ